MRIGAGQQGEGQGQIGDVAGEQADGVERRRQRHRAGAADQAPGRPESGDTAAGGRHADRPAGIGAQGEGNDAGRHRGGRAARGAAADVGRVVRIAAVADMVIVAGDAEGEFGHIETGESNGPGGLELGDGRRIRGRRVVARIFAPQLAIRPLRWNISLCASGTPNSGPPRKPAVRRCRRPGPRWPGPRRHRRRGRHSKWDSPLWRGRSRPPSPPGPKGHHAADARPMPEPKASPGRKGSSAFHPSAQQGPETINIVGQGKPARPTGGQPQPAGLPSPPAPAVGPAAGRLPAASRFRQSEAISAMGVIGSSS